MADPWDRGRWWAVELGKLYRQLYRRPDSHRQRGQHQLWSVSRLLVRGQRATGPGHGYADAYANHDTDGHIDAYFHAHADTRAHTHPKPYADANSDAHGDADPNADDDPHAYLDSYAQPDTNRNTHTYGDAAVVPGASK